MEEVEWTPRVLSSQSLLEAIAGCWPLKQHKWKHCHDEKVIGSDLHLQGLHWL